MPIKNLNKIQKKLSKKRGKLNALHEDSRNAKSLRRAGAREDRIARVVTSAMIARQSLLDRVAHFQECLKEASEPFTIADDEIVQLIQKWINRDDEEIKQLHEERRKGRPPSKREENLQQRKTIEEKEYRSGFWMPDIAQQEVRQQMALWNGEWSSLSSMKFIRFAEGGVKQASTFPPKGLS
ncbi:translation machinery-associated protein 16 [Talaromyces proteolyticus]|uniref:Translation machinery-associated protein 16 n=1 Tax=Talaromyces proteolyticus TaxID=1131652 RepID=A0AAD4KL66_9EURO|nr:translation machinery-associated protein 16 [Talaromyces proteolyticus]KAH8693943.1 translation machinery-associated protein 16 [Talaromyces proteolyticus]